MSGTDSVVATPAEFESGNFTHGIFSTDTQMVNSDLDSELFDVVNIPEQVAKAMEYIYRQEVLFLTSKESLQYINEQSLSPVRITQDTIHRMYGFSGTYRSWLIQYGQKLELSGKQMPPLPRYLIAASAEDRWIPEILRNISSLESTVDVVQMNIPLGPSDQ